MCHLRFVTVERGPQRAGEAFRIFVLIASLAFALASPASPSPSAKLRRVAISARWTAQ
jgi:hypothetical protein